MEDHLSFVAIDFETANSSMASVCQVGVSLVIDGVIQRTESWYVIPPTGLDSFDPFNTRIHGITAETVAQNQGLTWQDSLTCIHQFVQDRPLVAHNSRFDHGVFANATRYVGAEDCDYTWHDTLALSRRQFPTLTDHKLPTVAAHLGIPFGEHHDAGADARAAAEIVVAVARRERASLTSLFSAEGKGLKESSAPSYKEYGRANTARVSELPKPRPDSDPNHPLHGHHVVLTGGLRWITRWEAFELLAWCGAQPQNNVTKKTTILVVSANDDVSEDANLTGASGKERKALEYRAKGQEIKAITAGCLEAWTRLDLPQLHEHNRGNQAGPPEMAEGTQGLAASVPESADSATAASHAEQHEPASDTSSPNHDQAPAEKATPIVETYTHTEAESVDTNLGPSLNRSEQSAKRQTNGAPLARAAQTPGLTQTPISSSQAYTWPVPVRPRRVFLARTGAVFGVLLIGVALLFLTATFAFIPSQMVHTNKDAVTLVGNLIGVLLLVCFFSTVGWLGIWLLLRRKKYRRPK